MVLFQISFKLDKVTVQNSVDLELHCRFAVLDTRHKTIASITEDRISCPLPEKYKLPSFPVGLGKNKNDSFVFMTFSLQKFQPKGK